MLVVFSVVWNPWKEKAESMADMGEGTYPYMVCVEAGHVASPAQLEAGNSFHASQTLTALVAL